MCESSTVAVAFPWDCSAEVRVFDQLEMSTSSTPSRGIRRNLAPTLAKAVKMLWRFIETLGRFEVPSVSRGFDQGKAHPAQRPGHRTTSIVTPLAPFLERCEARPYHSYWEVATDRLD